MLKNIIKRVSVSFKLLKLVRFLERLSDGAGISILYGHRVISDNDFSNIDDPRRIAGHTSVSDVENAILLMKKQGYRFISIGQAAEEIAQGKISQDSVVLTFDDGFYDNLEYLLPVLKKHQVPAAYYINASVISSDKNLWFQSIQNYFFACSEDKLPIRLNQTEYDVSTAEETFKSAFHFTRYLQANHRPQEFHQLIEEETKGQCKPSEQDRHLTWDELEKLSKEPLITLGAHSYNHYPLSLCDEELSEFEIKESIEKLEKKLDMKIEHFSYPRGHIEDFNDFHIKVLKSCNIVSGVSTIRGVNRRGQDMFRIKRVGLPADTIANGDDFLWHLAGIPQLLSSIKRKLLPSRS